MPAQRTSPVWAGWIMFATLIMLVIGVVNVLEGILTLIYRERVVLVQDRLYVVDLTGWGVVVLVFGAILVAVGIGLLSAKTWARIAAIVVVVVHAIAQIGSFDAYPAWSLLRLALDVVVLYALTVRWPEVAATRREYAPPSSDSVDRRVITNIPTGTRDRAPSPS